MSAFATVCTLLRYAGARRTRAALTLCPDTHVEHDFGGPLGTILAGLGMGAFYIALIWINMLLGMFLTPLFLIPLTWIQDAIADRKKSG